jgi:hypothetical protein
MNNLVVENIPAFNGINVIIGGVNLLVVLNNEIPE